VTYAGREIASFWSDNVPQLEGLVFQQDNAPCHTARPIKLDGPPDQDPVMACHRTILEFHILSGGWNHFWF